METNMFFVFLLRDSPVYLEAFVNETDKIQTYRPVPSLMVKPPLRIQICPDPNYFSDPIQTIWRLKTMLKKKYLNKFCSQVFIWIRVYKILNPDQITVL